MVDSLSRLDQITAMIEEGAYFMINRPRQYGKTTTLFLLSRSLKKKKGFFPLKLSFEGISSESYSSEAKFLSAFLSQIEKDLRLQQEKEILQLFRNLSQPQLLTDLDFWISDFIEAVDQKVVLLIDEIDKSSSNQLFLDFLGILRSKYLGREEGDLSFHSVVLAGVHDIKTLKLKIRDEQETQKLNSPWNIAAKFKV